MTISPSSKIPQLPFTPSPAASQLAKRRSYVPTPGARQLGLHDRQHVPKTSTSSSASAMTAPASSFVRNNLDAVQAPSLEQHTPAPNRVPPEQPTQKGNMGDHAGHPTTSSEATEKSTQPQRPASLKDTMTEEASSNQGMLPTATEHKGPNATHGQLITAKNPTTHKSSPRKCSLTKRVKKFFRRSTSGAKFPQRPVSSSLSTLSSNSTVIINPSAHSSLHPATIAAATLAELNPVDTKPVDATNLVSAMPADTTLHSNTQTPISHKRHPSDSQLRVVKDCVQHCKQAQVTAKRAQEEARVAVARAEEAERCLKDVLGVLGIQGIEELCGDSDGADE
ncbi:hypothetical protein M011DRAFT_464146 [Sporormia fimetaria CBS 119925]|uniref:Uncharacterized protein n=1 Tax=Sporormia fimetaria CBS 119925 TaxID=1340428 RepID=A0A6A6VLC9_9PLEO|nr:hypothetical protein M011DRAFT_464146 [Sporormia fimetaria CBS 119925]